MPHRNIDYQKKLYKQSKLIKIFECQKIVRKLKKTHKINYAGDKKERRIKYLEGKLRLMKNVDHSLVVKMAMDRMGLYNGHPIFIEDEYKEVTEIILRHKRLVLMMHLESQRVFPHQIEQSKLRCYNNKKYLNLDGHDNEGGLFLESLSGNIVCREKYTKEDIINDYCAYQNLKKKRPGQRSRKAKALAIEAFKSGEKIPPNKSLNWRNKKVGKGKETNIEQENNRKLSLNDVANMGKIWKEKGKTHPSWAAKEIVKIKEGIVDFEGSRIKF